jgi:predicted metal-dependent phosphoesterase TrpH
MDSLIRPVDLAKKSARLGIIPAIADHNSIKAHADMHVLGAQCINGEEIFTEHGDLVGLYMNELIPKGTPFLEAIDRIHGQGGLAYIPHMFDHGRSGRHASDKEAAEADIIEVFNARCMDQGFNRKAAEFATKHSLLKGVGTDSHFLFEFGTTYAELPDFDIDSPAALLKSLKSKSVRFTTKQTRLYARGTTTVISATRRLWRRIRGNVALPKKY